MEHQLFDERVAPAMRQPSRAAMRPVVEKEILHYDSFYALDVERSCLKPIQIARQGQSVALPMRT